MHVCNNNPYSTQTPLLLPTIRQLKGLTCLLICLWPMPCHVCVPVTSHTQPTPKAFNFKLSPRNADVLTQQLRLNFAATANNHVLDYGQAGLAETHEVCVGCNGRHAGPATHMCEHIHMAHL